MAKKKQGKQEEKFFIERVIPYALRQRVAALGAGILPVEERTAARTWYAYSLKGKEEIEALVDDYCKGYGLEEEDSCKEGDSAKPPCFPGWAAEAPLSGMGAKIHREPDIHFNWNAMLEDWDSLRAVQAIKEHGLPPLPEQRAYILDRLAERVPGEQYNVVYEDLCEYSGDFKEAYGWGTVMGALKEAHITNGFNLVGKVNTSSLPEEMKKLLLYVFPSVRRESPAAAAEGKEEVRELRGGSLREADVLEP